MANTIIATDLRPPRASPTDIVDQTKTTDTTTSAIILQLSINSTLINTSWSNPNEPRHTIAHPSCRVKLLILPTVRHTNSIHIPKESILALTISSNIYFISLAHNLWNTVIELVLTETILADADTSLEYLILSAGD